MTKVEKVLIASIDYETSYNFYHIPKKYLKACDKMLRSTENDFDRKSDFHAAELFRFLMHMLDELFCEKIYFVGNRPDYASVIIDKKSKMVLEENVKINEEDNSTGEAVCFYIDVPLEILDKNKFCIPKDYQMECLIMAANIAAECPTPIGDNDCLMKKLMFKYILDKLEILFEGASCGDHLTICF